MEIDSCVRGYHVFQSVWTPILDDNLICRQETGNVHDRYAVGCYKLDDSNGTSTLVGHVPKTISILCYIFLRNGNTITCSISGDRRHSSDLIQGGMEIPCKLRFLGQECDIKKLKKIDG